MTGQPLTRAQVAALTHLHRYGRLNLPGTPAYWLDRAHGHPVVLFATHRALWRAKVAKPGHGASDTGWATTPLLHTYADGEGTWYVEVPATVHPDSRAAVARAVIIGEVLQRTPSNALTGWRPRVERVAVRGGEHPHSLYREV